MKKRVAPLIALGLFAACASPDSGSKSITSPESPLSSNGVASELNLGQANGPADAHVHHVRGFDASNNNANPNGQAGAKTPNMTNHGGKIMTTANSKSIFWGTSWATYSGDKMTGIDAFYAGWNNSIFARTNIDLFGPGSVVWASDYPHRDAQFPGTAESLLARTDLTPEELAAAAGGNAVRFYRMHAHAGAQA